MAVWIAELVAAPPPPGIALQSHPLGAARRVWAPCLDPRDAAVGCLARRRVPHAAASEARSRPTPTPAHRRPLYPGAAGGLRRRAVCPRQRPSQVQSPARISAPPPPRT
eukprot:CAMPEP_0206018796 /NCGR_PEP_ID=MMETSP1464-20131121/27864_1 /ASSEMBLY_ACC=CAM_ASM_001124 /TAXON_ID=119497 /ORGANISM="Exanthemachrysis gayraliae, Strain RCC1523" /LENGTH=108 /DNA_ID=CAMNT_0053392683 /DNA_START=167 /DNA_END=491 /DNA_ORIENTATION=-